MTASFMLLATYSAKAIRQGAKHVLTARALALAPVAKGEIARLPAEQFEANLPSRRGQLGESPAPRRAPEGCMHHPPRMQRWTCMGRPSDMRARLPLLVVSAASRVQRRPHA
ncbi:hypothetical protein B0H10DRAFT_2227879 [Mycena sp. CBHHK59/15]|nr:hypothetical protein B0H10DRAFT_2227879 [Mycena sp. CBHHK59/15]